ncbi:AraC family transcriptional regulator [uncultured Methylobacterium sp.]|uniref:AraC family transcriptional regulator n=1 Tax=uncultured Methylobacterium sp. TaxID=157278 RepID=UPI00262B98AF|nr:AraC family transcriptional regulator [uncultured Methylobacterium sp.]
MPGPDFLRLTRDPETGIEAVEARFTGHAYDLHRHDEWLVGVTGHGVQDFFCRGARRRSTAGRVILIEPGEAHDGQAVTPEGFSYAMLYLPQAWLGRDGPLPPARGGFRATLSDDPALGRAILRACRGLAGAAPRLSREAALDAVRAGLCRHLGVAPDPEAPAWQPAIAQRARECLHAGLAEDPGTDALARAAGAADRFQLVRAFRAAYGTSPHAYLVQIRLVEARRRLKAGETPAAVAAACGFADQSHLGRWFRRAYGVTPAAYRAGGVAAAGLGTRSP